jgi:NCS2 family nucleobase:cation symporter-2
MPDWTGPILHSGITLGAIAAIVLNLLLNSDRLGSGAEGAGHAKRDAARPQPVLPPHGMAHAAVLDRA